jgi:hypothetical protein
MGDLLESIVWSSLNNSKNNLYLMVIPKKNLKQFIPTLLIFNPNYLISPLPHQPT